jgi:ribosome-binding protein aMBF1 (putative translation factor)
VYATPADIIFRKSSRVPEKKQINERYGQIIARYREIHGDTQSDLAMVVGKERNTISQYEHGKINIPFQVRELASKRYGIPRHH